MAYAMGGTVGGPMSQKGSAVLSRMVQQNYKSLWSPDWLKQQQSMRPTVLDYTRDVSIRLVNPKP